MIRQLRAQTDSGQAIILLVLALVGVLGFAALAIDGGNIFTEQRRAQNAADNAALGAAYDYSQGVTSLGTLTTSARANAALNGFDNNGTSNWVDFYSPPTSGPYAGNANYMQVVITRTVPTALAHLVYSGPWQVRASALAYGQIYTRIIPYSGQAMMATNESACGALTFSGTGDVTIVGAGIFTNSDCNSGCNLSGAAGVAQGSSQINITGGIPGAAGCWYDPHSNLSPAGVSYQTRMPGASTPPPTPTYDPGSATDDCGPDQPAPSGSPVTISPGTYNGLDMNPGDIVKMAPGIYCLTDTLGMIQGTLTSDLDGNGAQNAGEGVLIYILPSVTGTVIDSNAQAEVHIDAMQNGDFKGMAIYYGMALPCSSIGTGTINGGGQSAITGTIYAPCLDLTVNGNSGTFALRSQLIANTIEVNGGGNLNIVYDPNVIYSQPNYANINLVGQ